MRSLPASRLLLAFVLVLGSTYVFAQPVTIVNAFPGRSFTNPIFLTHAEDGTNRIFVVQQNGQIKVFPNDSTTSGVKIFLNITAKLSSTGGEEGLLGLAFHPDYSFNGYFYVNYTAPGPLRTVIARYQVLAGNPDKGDSLSEFKILEINQPYSNHNGGMIAFGADGYLYIGMGDGGDANDPQNRSQNRDSLLGKMLRIDVNDTTVSHHYAIPSDNPLVGNPSGWREEIWAWGLRNPWRWSFDKPTGVHWLGDVGQGTWEEVNILQKGGNYGWKIMEGMDCRPGGGTCDTSGLIKPIKVYDHNTGNSITGGYVYRGYRRPDLTGAYVYADYGSGKVWMLRYAGGNVTADSLLIDAPFPISSFGMDRESELYIVSYSGSAGIYRFAGNPLPTSVGEQVNRSLAFRLEQNYPNPFNPSTTISYELLRGGRVRLTVLDVLGREIALLAEGDRPAGSLKAVWETRGVASGVYFYRLTAPGGVITRSMMLIR